MDGVEADGRIMLPLVAEEVQDKDRISTLSAIFFRTVGCPENSVLQQSYFYLNTPT
jgi:hypothetical protein